MKAETVESILAGIRGPVERDWRNTVVLYLPATDDEKAAALDAAIEFEDRVDLIDPIDGEEEDGE